jgi:hypothetical protein
MLNRQHDEGIAPRRWWSAPSYWWL